MTNALANANRLQILELLKNPAEHFSPGEFDETEGVCGLHVAEKLGISAPTASAHLRLLSRAGFLTSLRVGKFTYFKRVERSFKELSSAIKSL